MPTNLPIPDANNSLQVLGRSWNSINQRIRKKNQQNKELTRTEIV